MLDCSVLSNYMYVVSFANSQLVKMYEAANDMTTQLAGVAAHSEKLANLNKS